MFLAAGVGVISLSTTAAKAGVEVLSVERVNQVSP
jgi:hypothetical protein